MSLSTDAPRQTELRTIRAVLFDFAETLFVPEEAPRRIDAALLRLGREQLPEPDIDQLAALIETAFESKDYLALRDRQDLSAADHRAAFTTAFAAAEAKVEGLAEAMYDRLTEPASWEPFADTRSTLESLHEHGIRVGVVSNIGFDIRTVFSHHGLVGLVDTFALSFEHGVIKPDPALFEVATRDLGVRPTETLMVGDNIADAGAVRTGIRVYLLPPVLSRGPRGLGEVLRLCVPSQTGERAPRQPAGPPAWREDVEL